MPVILLVLAMAIAAPFVPSEPCLPVLEFEPKAAGVQFPGQLYEFKVRAAVSRHADHRALDLQWEGPVSGRSTRQLEGDEDAVTHRFQLRDLPGGRYVFTARVINNQGKVVGVAELKTICPESDERCQ